MQIRHLGHHGPAVSALGLGCMGMSDFYGSKTGRDDAESLATIAEALDRGVTLLDTGDFYGMGHNEALVGKAIAGRRDSVFLSVKFGAMRSFSGGFLGFDGRPAAVKNFAAYSLQRLGVDVIDLYQPARVDPAVPYEDTIGAVADLIREGKVRFLGISEASAEQMRRAHAVHPVAALEIEYSLATRLIEDEILPVARELGVGIVAYGALSRGLLSGTFDGTLAPGDFRAHSPRFTGENLAHNLERVAALKKIAARKGCTASQLAIAWVLSRGGDIVPIVGTAKRTRLRENLQALEVELDPSDLAELNQMFAPGAIAGDRYPEQQMRLVAR